MKDNRIILNYKDVKFKDVNGTLEKNIYFICRKCGREHKNCFPIQCDKCGREYGYDVEIRNDLKEYNCKI